MESLSKKFEELKKVLKQVDKPLFVIHPRPDADALGAAFALRSYLKDTRNIEADIFSIDRPPKNLDKLFPGSKVIGEYSLDQYDSIFIIDRGDVYFRLGIDKNFEKLEKKIPIINIDHHPYTFIPGAINILDTKAAATSEIIYRFFEYTNYDIPQEIAQFILDGIFSDTGGFRHNNTTAQTLEIAAGLMKKGASISKINRELFANKSINTLKLWSIALERAKVHPKTGMVVSFITKQDLEKYGADEEEISGISEILNTITESNFSLVLSERETGKIKASLRSEEHKGVDVSKIARQFKGGGHKLASGFEIKGKLTQVGDSWIIE